MQKPEFQAQVQASRQRSASRWDAGHAPKNFDPSQTRDSRGRWATVGSIERAEAIAAFHFDDPDAFQDGFERLAAGDYRSVYIDWETDTVYKVGSDEANRHEHEVLSKARSEGKRWAPPTTIYEVTAKGRWGGEVTSTVIAMPYLPDEGGEADEEEDLMEIFTAAGDLNTENIHINGGQMWLVDAGGMP